MQRAIAGLAVPPDLILVDALEVPGVAVRQKPIVKGDALSVSIAAASVVAKVERDAMMREYDQRYPGYGLGHNMGYAARATTARPCAAWVRPRSTGDLSTGRSGGYSRRARREAGGEGRQG